MECTGRSLRLRPTMKTIATRAMSCTQGLLSQRLVTSFGRCASLCIWQSVVIGVWVAWMVQCWGFLWLLVREKLSVHVHP